MHANFLLVSSMPRCMWDRMFAFRLTCIVSTFIFKVVHVKITVIWVLSWRITTNRFAIWEERAITVFVWMSVCVLVWGSCTCCNHVPISHTHCVCVFSILLCNNIRSKSMQWKQMSHNKDGKKSKEKKSAKQMKQNHTHLCDRLREVVTYPIRATLMSDYDIRALVGRIWHCIGTWWQYIHPCDSILSGPVWRTQIFLLFAIKQ